MVNRLLPKLPGTLVDDAFEPVNFEIPQAPQAPVERRKVRVPIDAVWTTDDAGQPMLDPRYSYRYKEVFEDEIAPDFYPDRNAPVEFDPKRPNPIGWAINQLPEGVQGPAAFAALPKGILELGLNASIDKLQQQAPILEKSTDEIVDKYGWEYGPLAVVSRNLGHIYTAPWALAEGVGHAVSSGLGTMRDYLGGAPVGKESLNRAAFDLSSTAPLGVGATKAASGVVGRAADTGDLGVFAGRRAATTLAKKGRPAPQMALDLAEMLERSGLASPDEIALSATIALREQAPEFGGVSKGVDGNWRFEIDDSQSRLAPDALDSAGAPMKFSEALYHPEMFEAYPELADLPTSVSYGDDLSGQFRETFDPLTNKFTPEAINLSAQTDEQGRSGMLHEGQHAVQSVEGFAAGGNPMMFGENENLLRQNLEPLIRDIARKEFGSNFMSLPRDVKATIVQEARKELYKRMAGEVEARNVQARADMPASERAWNEPRFTQDTLPRGQILVDNKDRLIGPQFSEIFAGRKAADDLARQGIHGPKNAIERADQMRASGESPARIYEETSGMLEGTPYAGVHYGIDGNPRFEISDAPGTEIIGTDKYAQPIPTDGLQLDMGDPKRSLIRRRASWDLDQTGLEGPYIAHPELAKAYPELSNTDFNVTSSQKIKERGGLTRSDKDEISVQSPNRFSPDTGRMDAADVDFLTSGLAHELDHRVSDIEGHSPGGNPDIMRGHPLYEKSRRADRIFDMLGGPPEYHLYERLAGETQARNTQNRLPMSAAERRATPPWQTQDTPYHMQVEPPTPAQYMINPWLPYGLKLGTKKAHEGYRERSARAHETPTPSREQREQAQKSRGKTGYDFHEEQRKGAHPNFPDSAPFFESPSVLVIDGRPATKADFKSEWMREGGLEDMILMDAGSSLRDYLEPHARGFEESFIGPDPDYQLAMKELIDLEMSGRGKLMSLKDYNDWARWNEQLRPEPQALPKPRDDGSLFANDEDAGLVGAGVAAGREGNRLLPKFSDLRDKAYAKGLEWFAPVDSPIDTVSGPFKAAAVNPQWRENARGSKVTDPDLIWHSGLDRTDLFPRDPDQEAFMARLAEGTGKQYLGRPENDTGTFWEDGQQFYDPAKPPIDDYQKQRLNQAWRQKVAKTGELFANNEDAGIVGAAMAAGRDMTPFYGEDVGPKGRIAPETMERFSDVRSGLPGSPTAEGRFNQNVGALLQSGVADKQTWAYYKKQILSRGGKKARDIDAADKKWKPTDVLSKEELARFLDARAPVIKVERYGGETVGDEPYHVLSNERTDEGMREVTYESDAGDQYIVTIDDDAGNVYVQGPDGEFIEVDAPLNNQHGRDGEMAVRKDIERRIRGGNYDDSAQWEDYAISGGDDYREVAVGYPKEPTQSHAFRPSDVGKFTDDAHMPHENLEGWYRAQDFERLPDMPGEIGMRQRVLSSGKVTKDFEAYNKRTGEVLSDIGFGDEAYIRNALTRRSMATPATESVMHLDEVQPQRYERMRDRGPKPTANELGYAQERVNQTLQERNTAQMDAAVLLDLEPDSMEASNLVGLRSRLNSAISNDGQPVPREFRARINELKEARERLQAATNAHADAYSKLQAMEGGVEPSPYTGSINDATDHIAKQALIDAARGKNPPDRISWSDGDTVADLMGIQSRVHVIDTKVAEQGGAREVRVRGNDGYDIAQLTVDQNGIVTRSRSHQGATDGIEGKRLEEVVGKDVARKILSVEPGQTGQLMGDDLRIGGEGMRGFYGTSDPKTGTVTPGILGERLQSQLGKLGQKNSNVEPIRKFDAPVQLDKEVYPSVRLDPETADKIRSIGLSLYANSDEMALVAAAMAAAESHPNPTVRAAQKRAANVPFEDKLAVQHNMRGGSFAHNMRSYDGNIPVPSLAISKAGQPLTNFGDISLFADPSMAIPKGSNPVYPADAYTKRAPKIVRDVPLKADRDRMVEKLTGEKGKGYTLELNDPYWDTNFRVGYLRSKGLTPPEGVRPDDWVRNAIGYGERDAVEAFVNDFLDSNQGIIRERIYQGYDDNGNQRYRPHTLDNMVKASKGKAGSEDFDYGPNAWRAHTMSPFRSLGEMQENRGLINRVPKEEMEALKSELAEKGFRLTEAMGYRDTYADMVLDGLRHPDPEVRNLAKELRDDLAKLPTEYFEGKPQRAVGINEFKLAAVPETMPDVARSLDRMGLDVRTYDRSKMGEHGEPLTNILRTRPDILFANDDQLALPGIIVSGADEQKPNRLLPQMKGDRPARNLSQLGTYSKLGESISNSQMKAGNGQQWLNLFKKDGVKAQEMYWTGMDDWLAEQGNRKISKEEVEAAFKEREVRVWREQHDTEGVDPSTLIENEIQNYVDMISEDGVEARRMPVTDEMIAARIGELDIHIEEAPANDLFGYTGFVVARNATGKNGRPVYEDGFVTREDAEARAAEMAREDIGEQWALFRKDEDGTDYPMSDDIYESKRDAERDSGDVIQRYAEKNYEGMTVGQVLDDMGYHANERTSHYVDDSPDGGASRESYVENVVGINKQTLERKGSKGWEAAGADDVHPDSLYDHSPGWTLEEDYGDLGGRGSGRVVHEMQSRWGQAGSEKGFRSAANQADIDKFKAETEAAQAHYDSLDGKFVGDPDHGVYKVMPGALPSTAARLDVVLGQRRRAEEQIRINQERIERYRESLKNDSEGLVVARRNVENHPDGGWEADVNDYEKGIREIELSIKGAEAEIQGHRAKLKDLEEDIAGFGDSIQRIPDHKGGEFEQIPYGGPPKSALESTDPLVREYAQWFEDQAEAQLRLNESRRRWDSSLEGVEPGPFVMSTSDFTNLLSKNALTRAAQDRSDWVAWSGPGRMARRWGPHLKDYYSRTLPDTMLKLAKQHDPSVELETFFPGDTPEPPRGQYIEERTALYPEMQNPNYAAPNTQIDMFPIPRDEGRRIPGNVRASSTSPVVDIELFVPSGGEFAGQSFYRLINADGLLVAGDNPQASSSYSGGPLFRSRESAERAMEQINRDLSARKSQREPTLEEISEQWGDDDMGEAYRGFRMSPEMAESIRKYGFPLFANPAEMSFPAFSTMMAQLIDGEDVPEESFGNRSDGTPKGRGFLGPMQRDDGDVSTEMSIGVNLGGQEVEIPLLVPTLSSEEQYWLLHNNPDPRAVPQQIVDKAVQHAIERMNQGLSPFAD
jgi:hypothetical protein